jgi:uncharacterized protein YmfQ (DUF2313 family)
MARNKDEFAKLLLSLFPSSKWNFWTRSLLSKTYKELKGYALEFSRIDQRIDDLVNESYTSKITELLEEWESDFALPENSNQLANTIEGRRKEINAKLIQVGRQDQNYYIQIALALGYTVTIETFSPAIVGVMEIGDSVGDYFNLFYWKVNIDLDYITNSKQVNISKLIYNINKVKPAHTKVLFDFVNASFSRGFNKGFKSIPHYDNSWSNHSFGRGFNNGFSNAYDYDGINYIGGFHHGFNLGFDRHSGGGINYHGFNTGFKRPV